jgi:hypothetical protein
MVLIRPDSSFFGGERPFRIDGRGTKKAFVAATGR